MSYVRVDSSVPRNRKFVKAGPAASWLWLCGLAYSQLGLTDGFVPIEALEFLGVRGAKPLAGRLVAAGLWEAVDGGWRVHDYLEHNKPADEIRRVAKVRADGGQLGGRPPRDNLPDNLQGSGKVNLREKSAKPSLEKAENPSVPVSVSVPVAVPVAVPVPTGTGGAPARGGSPLHVSHKTHAHCGRICLHASLFDEFKRRRNHDDADAELRAWALEIERQWGQGGPFERAETGDAFDFWRARYAERWPPDPAAGGHGLTKATAGTLAAIAAIMREED